MKHLDLTPRQKEAIALVCEGLEFKEIAARMGTTEGTVKQFLFQARKRTGALTTCQLVLRHGRRIQRERQCQN